MKALAAVLHERGGKMVIEEIELAEPKEDEVLVKVVGVGVCHTDEGGRQWMIEPPVVLGHEGSGIVEKVGSNVTNLKKGDHVVLTIGSCGKCKYCLKKRPSACEKMGELNIGGKMLDGTRRISQNGKEINNFFGQSSFATYAVVSKESAVKVDKDVDIALLGPLGCGIQTGAGTVLECLKVEEGSTIAIFGCGSLGLSGVMAAKIAKCKTIICIDIIPSRLEFAKELGGTHTINPKEVKDVAAEIIKITNGGAEYAFETSGVPEVFQNSINCLAPLGKVALCGVGATYSFDPMQLIIGCKTVIGSNEGNLDCHKFIPQMVKYYKEGKFPIDKLVKYYEFKDIEKAFEDSLSGLTIKAILKMPQ